jgi:hypothetical protein
MSLSQESIDALRDCASIFSGERREVLEVEVDRSIQQGRWFESLTLDQVAALFYRNVASPSWAMLDVMDLAVKAGELRVAGTVGNQTVSMADLAAWSGCPRVPRNSPLRYWLPHTMRERDPNSTIDWPYWRAMGSIRLFQAIALSLDIDPEKLRSDADDYPDPPEEQPKFVKRLKLVLSNIHDRTQFTPIGWSSDPSFHDVKLGEVGTWLNNHGYELPPDFPLASSATVVAAKKRETPPAAVAAMADPQRRLVLLRSIGGSVKYRSGDWRFTGMKALVELEKSDGRGRADPKTVRADLLEAAEAERQSEKEGGFNWPR